VQKARGPRHFLSAVLDDVGICRGICAMDLRSMEVKTYPGGCGDFLYRRNRARFFGKSTNSVVCTGSAQSALFQQGVDYAETANSFKCIPRRFRAKTSCD